MKLHKKLPDYFGQLIFDINLLAEKYIIENQSYHKMSFHTGQNGYHQKYPQITNARESVERKEPSHTIGGNVNWYIHCGESMDVP